ncbi:aminodeoxychorismate synthase component I [Bacteroidetes bacterium endosymbiont of Geopemphigus sp.]|uniref:aminodeoxychorismate synthase component I n=1 Tax=Bacteroidetes bacterium endosymbiont of Geopemphigus sp. TaxID=2047937 RepID=UPI000CD1B48D|nr:aminodeoxychorismate synthase component I [Bacteroidetes bacterium endosymbiont of Geopemphigus sp.]
MKTAVQQMNQYGRESRPFFFMIDYEMERPVVLAHEEISKVGIYFKIGQVCIRSNPPMRIPFEKIPIDFEHYQKAFRNLKYYLQRGDTYLANLTFPAEIITPLSLSEIYRRSYAPYKLLYKNEFVVFSPECFIKIRNGHIGTYPMKGTIDATLPDARRKILSDEKEKAEHATIVDLLRNDLSQVARKVKVDRFRYIEKLFTCGKNLLQVSSQISGILPSDFRQHIGEILGNMLPAGSVSGAPKIKTMTILRNVEGIIRGYYTGIFGYFDGENLDSAVMIRFIERKNEHLYFRSGGGITAMSKVKKEYQELIDKIYVPII